MKSILHGSVLNAIAAASFAMLIALITAESVHGQGPSLFTTPSGRYYNPYTYGPYGSTTQGIGGPFSQGSPGMFNQGPPPPPVVGPVNLYQNPRYGAQPHIRPMVGPAYDPFRNGR